MTHCVGLFLFLSGLIVSCVDGDEVKVDQGVSNVE